MVVGTVAVEADFAGNVQAKNTSEDGPCLVEAGYDDQQDGAQVVVTDATGKTVGVGALKATGLQVLSGSTAMTDTWCGFTFSVLKVPRGSGFYGVAIGHRDPVQFPEDKLFAAPIALALGTIPGQS